MIVSTEITLNYKNFVILILFSSLQLGMSRKILTKMIEGWLSFAISEYPSQARLCSILILYSDDVDFIIQRFSLK